jgi:hypothetical protein
LLSRHPILRWLYVAVFAGCAGGQHASSNASGTSSGVITGRPESIGSGLPADAALPFDWITADYSQVSLEMRRGLRALIKPCMNAAGFDYKIGLEQEAPAFSLYRRYRYRTPADAEKLGFVVEQPPSGPEGTEAEFPADPAERKRYLIALQGAEDLTTTVPLVDRRGDSFGTQSVPGGCSAAAIVELYGSFENYVTYVGDDLWLQRVAGEAATKTHADPAFVQMLSKWSACMANSGYSFATPDDAIGAQWPEPRPGDTERQAARADAVCRDRVGFIATIVEIEGGYQRQALDAHSAMLQEVRTDRDELRARARKTYETSRQTADETLRSPAAINF